MSPRPVPRPKWEEKLIRQLEIEGLSIFGDKLNDPEEVGFDLRQFFDAVPAVQGHSEIPMRRCLNSLAWAYAEALKLKFGWKHCLLGFPEYGFNPENGVDAVLSPDDAYVVFPVGLVETDYFEGMESTRRIYSSIQDGTLPPANPGDMLWLKGGSATGEEPERYGNRNGQMFDEEVLGRFMKRWPHDLPLDYVDFLRTSAANVPVPSFFWVREGNWGGAFDEVYTMQEFAPHRSLIRALEDKHVMPEMLPIGGDGTGGRILMSFRTGEEGSIYFSASYSKAGAEREGGEHFDNRGYWRIAGSFGEFLTRLQDNPDEDEDED